MHKLILSLLLIIISFGSFAQANNESYQETSSRINDLVNTRLDVKFDYNKSYLYGQAWITLKPHFYPTDSLLLDAKGMDLKKVALVNNGKIIPLKYNYDGMKININLGKSIKGGEQYTIYILTIRRNLMNLM